MFVLVGPSASGKSTVAQVLVEQLGMKRAVTTTTRKRRRWEPVDAYHFVSKESFRVDDMVESQDMQVTTTASPRQKRMVLIW